MARYLFAKIINLAIESAKTGDIYIYTADRAKSIRYLLAHIQRPNAAAVLEILFSDKAFEIEWDNGARAMAHMHHFQKLLSCFHH